MFARQALGVEAASDTVPPVGRTAPSHALLRTRIAQRRLRAGLNQQDLAERTGFSVPTIQRLERGITFNPGIRQLALIAEALGCSIDDLVEPAWRTADQPFDPEAY